MNLLRKILFPIGFIYWLVTYIRNWLYDIQFFKSKSYNLPVIAIGNLSVGGTGKTPHTEYLIRLLKDNYKVAVLSRGYKRSTKGFLLADQSVSSSELGDESYQIYSKFPDVTVAVCENRQIGIETLISNSKPDVILLDDAFQHRKVKAGFYVLLTAYDDLFSDDYILPFGNLRESAIGKKRADLVIVTKCPPSVSIQEQELVKKKLSFDRPVFFTAIEYDENVFSQTDVVEVEEIKQTEKLIVAGIAKPEYFVNHLQSEKDVVKIYPDHHNFTENELLELKELTQKLNLITTEKDYVRLKDKVNDAKLYYLPIQSKFLNDADLFDKTINNWVKNYLT